MSLETEDILRDLAQNAESVCRHYLPAGKREGSYWMVGDLQNNPGRSLFVRLKGPTSGQGAAGRWTDGATGEHGDLLDIIRERTGITRFPDLLAEARAHLGRPAPVVPEIPSPGKTKPPSGTSDAAARLYSASVPIAGTLAETYLRARGITCGTLSSALRFHPKCWHRDEGQTKSLPRPALIAAITDGAGALQGVHRTWLAPDGKDKAQVEIQRRAMGHLLGNAVRLTPCDDILVVGEGIETMLSVREAAPGLPTWAALSSGHLGALLLPKGLQRLYIAIDRDPAGHRAAERLGARAIEAGIEARVLEPRLGDFNDDLRADGAAVLRQHLARQIGPEDRQRRRARAPPRRGSLNGGAGGTDPSRVGTVLPASFQGLTDPPLTHTAFKRWAGGRQRSGPFKEGGRLISAGGASPAFASRKSNQPPPRPPPHAFRPAKGRVKDTAPRRLSLPMKAARDEARTRESPGGQKKMTFQTRDDAYEPAHTASQTAHALEELQLYGYRPFDDEPDPRPMPDADRLRGAVADIFDALVASLADTRMEPDLEEVLWGQVNLFHRATARIERSLDDNEQAQRRLQREQDGSEVKSTELERQVAEGLTLTERRNCMDMMRDHAATEFWHHTGSTWRPRTGSMVNHQHLTAALIDSRDFLAAKRRAETEVMLPAGPKVALTGGNDFNDHRLIWGKLDQVRTKYPDMVLLHGGSPKGAELIAAKWAEARGVTQVAFKPDWTKHAKAAPFKRNDAMLDVLPVGVLVFPGNGIQENLADKAKKLGIPVVKFERGA